MSYFTVVMVLSSRKAFQAYVQEWRIVVLISRLVSSGWSMSALHPKADICRRIEHVCFVPLADIWPSGYDCRLRADVHRDFIRRVLGATQLIEPIAAL